MAQYTPELNLKKRMQDIGQHMRAYDPDIWVRLQSAAHIPDDQEPVQLPAPEAGG